MVLSQALSTSEKLEKDFFRFSDEISILLLDSHAPLVRHFFMEGTKDNVKTPEGPWTARGPWADRWPWTARRALNCVRAPRAWRSIFLDIYFWTGTRKPAPVLNISVWIGRFVFNLFSCLISNLKKCCKILLSTNLLCSTFQGLSDLSFGDGNIEKDCIYLAILRSREPSVTFGLLNLDHDSYNFWLGPEKGFIWPLCVPLYLQSVIYVFCICVFVYY